MQDTLNSTQEQKPFLRESDNPEMFWAFQAILEGKNVFIHGKAGTGKSYFIKNILRPNLGNTVFLSFTNIAALNIKGQTIHRFLSANPALMTRPFSLWPEVKKLEIEINLRHIKTLVIDEISMVHRDLFDKLDECLREIKNIAKPFGGLQIIIIGDLFQLPPIEKDDLLKENSFVFNSAIYKKMEIVFIELQKVYRQQDVQFAQALDTLRTEDDDNWQALEFLHMYSAEQAPINAPCLYPYRKLVEERNMYELSKLPPKNPIIFEAEFSPKSAWAETPAPEILKLKPKAPVIFLATESPETYVNSDIGIVQGINEIGEIEILNIRNNKLVYPQKHTWKQMKMSHCGYQVEDDSVVFKQYPLQLAYAMTIHKAQGLTLEAVSVNFGRCAFEYGQAYVALSRVRTVGGLYLESPIKPRDIKVSHAVKKFIAAQKPAYLFSK